MAYLKNVHKITDAFLAVCISGRWQTEDGLHNQWKVRPDADSHNKQQLTVQRARKAVAVKSVEEHSARSFVSDRQKGEKPDLLSKTFFFPTLQETHYMAQQYLVQMQIQKGTRPQSPCMLFFIWHTLARACDQQAVGLLSLYSVNIHIKSLHPKSKGYERLMAASHKDHQVLHQVPQREPTSSKCSQKEHPKWELWFLQSMTEEVARGHKQCECGAYICTVSVTFKSTNASPFNLFCRDSVQEIVL